MGEAGVETGFGSWRPELRHAPAHPNGERILIRPNPPVEKAAGGMLIIPAVAQKRPFGGRILAAGPQAAEKLYDAGWELGDEVMYVQFAGVVEEWTRILKPGRDPVCEHSRWEYLPKPGDRMELRECFLCGAQRLTEPIVVLNADDIIMNLDLQVRLESGSMWLERMQDEEGKTRYVVQRQLGYHDTRPDRYESRNWRE